MRIKSSRHKLSIKQSLLALWVGFAVALSNSSAFAQSTAREKPKIKDFGSSLKRLKWDAKKGALVETKRKDENGKGADEEEVERVETSLVVCDALVIDKKGRSVPGLTRDDFIVSEDDKPQEIGVFSPGDNADVPRTIVLIVDYSGSQYPFIKNSIEAAKTLIDQLSPRDTMAIVTDDVELLVGFTKDKEKLKAKLDSLEKRATSDGSFFNPSLRRFGRSAQYSALMATLHETFDGADLRPIVIFQTDGDEAWLLRDPIVSPTVPPGLPHEMLSDAMIRHYKWELKYRETNSRAFSLNDIFTEALKSRATIYSIIPGFRLLGLTPDERLAKMRASRERNALAFGGEKLRKRWQENDEKLPPETLKFYADQSLKVQTALAAVAGVTGGWADFLEEPSQASTIYARIFSDINRRYVIGYYPSNREHDGKLRKVSVEVRGHPEYTVWGRKSYYAPNAEN
jgi:VWFA-related protein